MELVEYSSGAELHIGSSKYGYGVSRERFCEVDAAVVVFLGGYARSYYVFVSVGAIIRHNVAIGRTFSSFQQMRMRLMERLSEPQFGRGDGQ